MSRIAFVSNPSFPIKSCNSFLDKRCISNTCVQSSIDVASISGKKFIRSTHSNLGRISSRQYLFHIPYSSFPQNSFDVSIPTGPFRIPEPSMTDCQIARWAAFAYSHSSNWEPIKSFILCIFLSRSSLSSGLIVESSSSEDIKSQFAVFVANSISTRRENIVFAFGLVMFILT